MILYRCSTSVTKSLRNHACVKPTCKKNQDLQKKEYLKQVMGVVRQWGMMGSWSWGQHLLKTFVLFLSVILLDNNSSAFLTSQDPSCPGTCTTFLICNAMSGKINGVCMDGKMCCSGNRGGFSIPMTGGCGSNIMGSKSFFRSPNYPSYASGTLICEFTLQLSPATVGVRVDFLDLQLPAIPSNPVNFFDSPNSVCDSDFLIFRGFSGWSPDLRCGNLTGYSIMIERENAQSSLSAVFMMTSMKYRWSILFTEIFFAEVETLDYSLKNMVNSNQKKQWVWYNSQGLSAPMPIGPPQTSLFNMPPWPVGPILARKSFPFSSDEVEAVNRTIEDVETENVTLTDAGANPSYDDHEFMSRIIGGVDAKPNTIPWQVSLQLISKPEGELCASKKRVSSHFCGGSIIGERAILSACHCFLSSSKFAHALLPIEDMKVVVGEHDFCKEKASSRREYRIARIILHYNYITTDVLNDIALIQLTKPIIFDQNVHQIHLADKETKMDALKPMISGWGSLGLDENSTFPSVLQQTTSLYMLTEKECQGYQREFLDFVQPDFKLSGKYKGAFNHGICTRATDNKTEAGFGDSGGPLSGIPLQGGNPILLGIISHMRPHVDPITNSEFHLNYFTKVGAYRSWILMSMS